MEKENLFENKTTLNKSIVTDGVKLWIKSFKFLKICKYTCAFLGICLITLSLLFRSYYSFIFGLSFELFFIIFWLFLLKKCTNTLSKKQIYTFGTERNHEVYDDRLEIRIEQSILVIPFYKIKIASENKEAFYMIYENQIICISKKGFTIGNSNKFGNFIKSKVKFI